jgi:hypothetical protein
MRVRPAVVSYIFFGLLQAVVLLVYSGSVQWNETGTWVYVGMVGVILTTGVVALVAGVRAGRVAG